MSVEQANLLLKELGETFNIPNLAFDESDTCSIRIMMTGAPMVHLTYIAPGDYILTFAEIGFIPLDRRLELLKEFLANNLFWQDTCGAVFAIVPETEKLVLQRRDDIQRMTVHTLIAYLDDFISTAVSARRRLFLVNGDDETNETETATDAIRV